VHFAKGSMAPKVEAAAAFVEATGGTALITNPESVERALAGETGTRIVGAAG
jgi:carbamate kinase